MTYTDGKGCGIKHDERQFSLDALGRLMFLLTVYLIVSFAALGQQKAVETNASNSGKVTIIGAAITVLASGLGWIVAYTLNSQREDRTKRLQLTIDHTSTQIREFYAPLVALTDQLNTMASIKEDVLRNKDQDAKRDLEATFYNMFFLPIHEEMNGILKTKVHLLEGSSTPDSFVRYFAHYASERAYWQLTQAGKDVSQMQVSGFPPAFYWDVRHGYQAVMNRYEGGLAELRHPPTGWLLRKRRSGRVTSTAILSPQIRGEVL